MSRLEGKLTEVACFENVPKNTPKGSGAGDGETSIMISHLLLAEFHVDQGQQRLAGFSTSDEFQFITALKNQMSLQGMSWETTRRGVAEVYAGCLCLKASIGTKRS